jgi:hypothetical protein
MDCLQQERRSRQSAFCPAELPSNTIFLQLPRGDALLWLGT